MITENKSGTTAFSVRYFFQASNFERHIPFGRGSEFSSYEIELRNRVT